MNKIIIIAFTFNYYSKINMYIKVSILMLIYNKFVNQLDNFKISDSV